MSLKSKLLKYSFVVAISINLLTINSGILLLTLNNKAEAGGGPPPPPVNPTTTSIDPKSAAKDINDELGATFDTANFFNTLKRKTKNQTNNHGPKLDPKKNKIFY
ncbi:hypothetical protein [Rickettsia endosymbiont of Gonocerus acuteangulatus]|uniref:hypothetical protein n=1 Tax=Rickettsia endosymbiont of Gonocerus acuteangulatus TaxID=3066266 RepID=UPI0031333B56